MHDDVDLAVWLENAPRIASLLESYGWVHAPSLDDDGGTAYRRGSVKLELTYLTTDEAECVFIPLRSGSALWSETPLGGETRELSGVRARVVDLAILESGKSSAREDPRDAAKDRADHQALARIRR